MAEPAAPDPDAAGQQFLTFRVDDGLYAVPAPEVREVVRPLPMARVPQSPASLLGLANLRGTVLPVASARGLLHKPAAPAGPTARLIVVDAGAPVGLLVDEIGALVLATDDEIEREGADLLAQAGEVLRGVFRLPGQGATVKVVDVARLLAGGFARLPRSRGIARAKTAATDEAAAPEVAAGAGIGLVSFDLGGQDYALPLDKVLEILPLPEAVSAVPRSDDAVLGVMTLRGALLPLLSLRALLGLPPDAAGAAGRMVVVALAGDAAVGLVVDRTRAILRVAPASVDPVPAVVTRRAAGEAAVQAICRLEGGRLVSVLAPDRLFREDLVRRSATVPEAQPGMQPAAAATAQFVVFRLGEEEYGLPIAAVDEVTLVPAALSRLPKTPDFVKGVMNLRGAVLPVIDQRRRFDLAPIARNERQRIVVVTVEGRTTGFIVDTVSRILKVPEDAIQPAPDLSDHQAQLIPRVINQGGSGQGAGGGQGGGGGIVLLLDPKELLDRTERGLLDAMRAAGGPQTAA